MKPQGFTEACADRSQSFDLENENKILSTMFFLAESPKYNKYTIAFVTNEHGIY